MSVTPPVCRCEVCVAIDPEGLPKQWNTDARKKRGGYWKCRGKQRATSRAYNEAHREERRAYQRAYDEAHREEKRAYNEAHREERRAYFRAYFFVWSRTTAKGITRRDRQSLRKEGL